MLPTVNSDQEPVVVSPRAVLRIPSYPLRLVDAPGGIPSGLRSCILKSGYDPHCQHSHEPADLESCSAMEECDGRALPPRSPFAHPAGRREFIILGG